MSKNYLPYIVACTLTSMVSYSAASPQDIQDGYNYQSKKINTLLEEKSSELSQTYDFEKVSDNGKIVPSLVCKKDEVQYYNGIKLKKSEVCNVKYKSRSLYKNETTKEILTWREFLIMPVHHDVITYKDNKDFKKGIKSANDKAMENVLMITEMYKGMVLYKSLVSQGMISNNKNEPIVNIDPDNEKNQGETHD